MTLAVLGLILAAAFMHATWNYLAKRAGGGAAFVWLCAVLSTVGYTPLALAVVVWQQPTIGLIQLVFILISAGLHIIYFVVLQRGYRSGDLSVVYPLARGTGPLLATVAAIIVFGERPTPLAIGGALLVAIGVFMVTGGLATFRSNHSGEGITYGVLTGAIIAAYTIADKQSVSMLLIPPLLLDYGATLGRVILLAPVAYRQRAEVSREWRQHRREVLGVAALTPLAYILVLTALVSTPVSYVAPAREISILIGVMMGSRLLGEGGTHRRMVAAGIMVAGIAALALG